MILDFDPVAVVQRGLARGLIKRPCPAAPVGLNVVCLSKRGKVRVTKTHPQLQGLARVDYAREYSRLQRRGLI